MLKINNFDQCKNRLKELISFNCKCIHVVFYPWNINQLDSK